MAHEFPLAKPHELKDKLPKQFLNLDFVYAEPKLDGFRGIAIVDNGKCSLFTRGGFAVVNGPKIVSALKNANSGIYDGEFFVDNWNDTGSIVKTLTPDHPKRDSLRFRIFDYISFPEWEARKGKVTLFWRRATLSQLKCSKAVEVIQATIIKKPTLEKLEKYFKSAVKQGHEGAVIKDPTSVYAFKKSNDWLKMKPFTESDLLVVDAKVGTGKHKGRLGALVCKGKIDGKKIEVSVGGGLTDSMREEYWALHQKNKLVGAVVEVKHEGITSNNALRFPRVFRLRWDKAKP